MSCFCGEPLPDARTICGRCERLAGYHLRDQEAHRVDLVVALTRQVRMHAPNNGSRGSSPSLSWLQMGDRYLDSIRPAEIRRLVATLPPARAAADALQAQRALLITWCKKLHDDAGGEWPERPRIGYMADHLRANLRHLHGHPDAPQLVRSLKALAAQVTKAIDIPSAPARIRVGPCPEDGCSGTIEGTFPHDQPPMMGCTGCDMEWNTTQWTRLGARIDAVVHRKGSSAGVESARENA